jgi:hypothetical protein
MAGEMRWVPIPVEAPIIDAPLDYPWGFIGPTVTLDGARTHVNDGQGSPPREVASSREAAEQAALFAHARTSDFIDPVRVVASSETPMAQVLDLLPHLVEAGVPGIALAYRSPLPEPRAPTLHKLRPRIRHLRLAFGDDSGFVDCEQKPVDVMSLEEGRYTSATPWSRIEVLGEISARQTVEVSPTTTYGAFMRRLVTGVSIDPPYALLELLDARERLLCRPQGF